MKEMSTIKFPNHTEAYEIVDEAARGDLEEFKEQVSTKFNELVGDTPVSVQINQAIADLSNLAEVKF